MVIEPGSATASFAYLLLLASLAAAAASDWRGGVIPNRLTYAAMLAGLAYWSLAGLWLGGVEGWWGLGGSAAGALLAGLLPGMALFFIGGLGGGDAKLLGAIGALSGQWQVVLAAAVYALLLAMVMAVIVMIRRRIVHQTLWRVAGSVVSILSRGRALPETDSLRIAFGVALGLGGAVAGAEYLLGVQLPWTGMGP